MPILHCYPKEEENQANPTSRSGDHRVTEQPGLTTLHTLFMRQHNEVAYKLAEVNPQWNDDRLYEEARKIIGAIMQHITYDEYLPKVCYDLYVVTFLCTMYNVHCTYCIA